MSSIVRYIRFSLLLSHILCPTIMLFPAFATDSANNGRYGHILAILSLLTRIYADLYISAVMSGALLRHSRSYPTNGYRRVASELYIMF
jgi:hypothetical protein